MRRRAELVFALLLCLAAVPPAAGAHDALSVEDEFVKGVFSPSFIPPPAGSYELPLVKRVPPFVLRDTAGHRVSTGAITAGKVAVISFIYTGSRSASTLGATGGRRWRSTRRCTAPMLASGAS